MTYRNSSLINLRKKLHQHAELAFNENDTANIIEEFISAYKPDAIYKNIAETGLIFKFSGKSDKPSCMFRADLDALPICERQNKDYVSINKKTSHMCGHDGHMTIVCSIATFINDIKDRGDIYLLFQPAEEIGAGAKQITQDPQFQKLSPDFIYGLHNLPEYPAGQFVIREGCFACSSVGLKIKIKGHSSHAANPSQASDPLQSFIHFQSHIKSFNSNSQNAYFLTTTTHLKLGEESFGITPGDLNIYLTLRSDHDAVLEKNKGKIKLLLSKYFPPPFEITIEELDYFPTTNNSSLAFDKLKHTLMENDFNMLEINEPLKWSEDFGYYTHAHNGCYFGLGTGIDVPLHHPDFDFNDNVIFDAQKFYHQLILNINK